ncbi:MAG: gamma-glutamylcyclotransferase family protein [Azospirillaceae bacterium]
MHLFVYGTLMDPDIREIVFGTPDWRVDGVPARLAGFRRDTILGGRAPVLVPHKHRAVDGQVLQGLDEVALARVVHFEGVARYRLAEVRVAPADRGEALHAAAFLPTEDVRAARRDWDLATWRRRHKAEFLRRARRHMAGYPARLAVRVATGQPA